MADSFILSNPDISGVGVRVAIYLQNVLTFAPVVVHLWDGKITDMELKATEGQSVGILSIAFAILISTIIQAKMSINAGSSISSFHAAVILDLSWMNNTSTFVWFLHYAHYRTWTKALIRPFNHLVDGVNEANSPQNRKKDEGISEGGKRSRNTFVYRLWQVVSEAPVLTLGSIHLSLMAAIGIWLWSDPPHFGNSLQGCDPILTIVGGDVPFSSSALQICSLFMYTLFLIPGLNLIIPFLFFILPHILYNNLVVRTKFQRTLNVVLRWRRRQAPPDPEALNDNTDVLTTSAESDNAPGPSTPSHTAFLIVGLVCLFAVNIIFMDDIELTLSRNNLVRSPDEKNWGFGQILALLLLVVPLRDLATSLTDIRRLLRRDKRAQTQFEEDLQKAVKEEKLDEPNFRDLIGRRADPNTQITGSALKFDTLLQLAAYKGNDPLVKDLLEKYHVNPTIGGGQYLERLQRNAEGRSPACKVQTAYNIAAHEGHLGTALWLLEKEGNGAFHGAIQAEVEAVIPYIVKYQHDSNHRTRGGAFECYSSLAAHKSLHDKIRSSVTDIVARLDDTESYDLVAALERISTLVAHSLCLELRKTALGENRDH
ncbi:hypothetical protein H0H87_004827 [Tephrocybe sp. NHM501043]|nr:hypothetical protein H0H87_004827 [Tephrocybe sp. NHM501043]